MARTTDPQEKSFAEQLPIEVIQVNGKPFVTGLMWEKLDRVRHYMREAREKGKTYGLDIVAIREGESGVQAGFSAKRAGVSKSMYSLAVVLGEALGDDFVAALELPDGRFAFVACSRSDFLPGCDVALSAEDAVEYFQEWAPLVRKQADKRPLHLIAPASFGVAGAEERRIEDVLDPSKLKRSHQLRALTYGLTGAEIRLVVMGVAIVVLGFVAWNLWRKNHPSGPPPKTAEQIRQDQVNLATRLAGSLPGGQQAPPPIAPHPWPGQAPVGLFVASCEKSFGFLPLSMAGWVLNSGKCQQGHMTAVYVRRVGTTLAAFRAAVVARFGTAVHMSDDIAENGETAGFEALFDLAPFPTDDTEPDADVAAHEALVSHFQALGLKVDWRRKPAPAAAPPGKPPTPVENWKTYTFTFNTNIPPPALLSVPSVSSFRITSYDFVLNPSTSQLTWTITGAIYGHL